MRRRSRLQRETVGELMCDYGLLGMISLERLSVWVPMLNDMPM
jgi:hypothetical protein